MDIHFFTYIQEHFDAGAKWGNSLTVRLPAAVVEALRLKDDGGQYTTELRTDEGGVAELTFRPSGAGANMRVTATDDAGRIHTRAIYLGAEMGENRLAFSAQGTLFAPGDKVDLTILSDLDLTRGYVNVYQGSRAVHSANVDFDNRRGELSF